MVLLGVFHASYESINHKFDAFFCHKLVPHMEVVILDNFSQDWGRM